MRLVDADELKSMKFSCGMHDDDYVMYVPIREVMENIDRAKTVGGWISVKDAANIIAELFGDDCACNFNGIDEWLPQYCEHAATDCPHTAGTTCWEQYIKYLNKKPDIGRKEGERNGKL